ncbi:hypothetical protein [Candidatus Electronema sp. PJ]|uniref:hypothetical protein n=1 Tax=Candidatus Electronema sp. PJ TaxID=3401572 RepID=UPI003AA8A1AE
MSAVGLQRDDHAIVLEIIADLLFRSSPKIPGMYADDLEDVRAIVPKIIADGLRDYRSMVLRMYGDLLFRSSPMICFSLSRSCQLRAWLG